MKIKGKLVTENNRTYIVVAGGSEYHEQNEVPLGQNEMVDVVCGETVENGMSMIMELPDFDEIIPFPKMLLQGQQINTTIMTRGNFGTYLRRGMKVAEVFNLKSFEPKDVEKGIEDLKEIKKGITKEENTPTNKDTTHTTTESRLHNEVITKNKQPHKKTTTETKDEVENIKNKFKDIA